MTADTTTEPTTVEAGAFALAYYHKPSREWWFIPTVPEGRKWRGPYRDWDATVKAVSWDKAYGDWPADGPIQIGVTTVTPQFLEASNG